eukprot:TRINITY_DN1818_c0_g3_i2.p1 TRINITY_DN1818_c0_g3~~TRINITY_DN1818_c0_g3_i2.p1  ORF type:complete len:329 (-),score=127.15 TRINITY_DN1818_c0_g3_i2:2-988(-)
MLETSRRSKMEKEEKLQSKKEGRKGILICRKFSVKREKSTNGTVPSPMVGVAPPKPPPSNTKVKELETQVQELIEAANKTTLEKQQLVEMNKHLMLQMRELLKSNNGTTSGGLTSLSSSNKGTSMSSSSSLGSAPKLQRHNTISSFKSAKSSSSNNDHNNDDLITEKPAFLKKALKEITKENEMLKEKTRTLEKRLNAQPPASSASSSTIENDENDHGNNNAGSLTRNKTNVLLNKISNIQSEVKASHAAHLASPATPQNIRAINNESKLLNQLSTMKDKLMAAKKREIDLEMELSVSRLELEKLRPAAPPTTTSQLSTSSASHYMYH